jgi:hypothetical protein
MVIPTTISLAGMENVKVPIVVEPAGGNVETKSYPFGLS